MLRKKYFLSKETAIIMAVLSLLALLVGVGGEWHWWFVPAESQPPDFLHVWFWPLFYPLMPVLKGWYVKIVHRICWLPLDSIYIEMAPWPFPPTIVWGFALTLPGFQVPGVWMPFLVHIPYWLALSYGLSALIHRYNKAVREALQKARTEGRCYVGCDAALTGKFKSFLRPDRLRVAFTIGIAFVALFFGTACPLVTFDGQYPLWFNALFWPFMYFLKRFFTYLCSLPCMSAYTPPFYRVSVSVSLLKPRELAFGPDGGVLGLILLIALIHLPYWYLLSCMITAAIHQTFSLFASR